MPTKSSRLRISQPTRLASQSRTALKERQIFVLGYHKTFREFNISQKFHLPFALSVFLRLMIPSTDREMSYSSSYMSTAYGATPRGRFYGSALREEIQADIDRARARIRRHVPYHPSYVPRVFEIAGMWRSAQAPSDFWRGVAPPHYFGSASRVSENTPLQLAFACVHSSGEQCLPAHVHA